MENFENEIKNLNKQRLENNLSLRKKKLNKEILKRRLNTSNNSYTIKKEDIIIKEEYKSKTFNSITDLLNFCTMVLSNENSDLNDIKFVIHLLKLTEIKQDNGEVSKSNIITEISKLFIKCLNDKVIIDELLGILTNFSYHLSNETLMNLLTNEYLNIYSKISDQYFEDQIIFNDLIILLGNLSNDNIVAQNIFYQRKLFEEVFKLAENPKAPKIKKDAALIFLANFTNGIQNNNNFVNNIQLLKKLIDIMVSNFSNKEYTVYCLESLGSLSDINSLAEYISLKKELFDFIFKAEKSDLYYYTQGNKILSNIAYTSDEICLYILQNYDAIPYILKFLNGSSNLLKGQTLFLLGNIIEDKQSKVNEILNNSGVFDKIFELLDSPNTDIIDKVTYILNIITGSMDNEGIFKLYKKNIHLKLINIIKNDYKRDIIDKTIDAIIDFLQKDSQDGIIKQSFIDNGLKEVLANMILDRNDAEIFFKTEKIQEMLKNYF